MYRLNSVLLQAMLSKTITFSSLTTPGIFQTSIEGSVEKRQGRWAGQHTQHRVQIVVATQLY
jgi:dynein heavy chain